MKAKKQKPQRFTPTSILAYCLNALAIAREVHPEGHTVVMLRSAVNYLMTFVKRQQRKRR